MKRRAGDDNQIINLPPASASYRYPKTVFNNKVRVNFNDMIKRKLKGN